METRVWDLDWRIWKTRIVLMLIAAVLLGAGCSALTERSMKREPAAQSDRVVPELPTLTKDIQALQSAVTAELDKRQGLSPEDKALYLERLTKYFAFLGLEPGTPEGQKLYQKIASRLLNSSTQFLACGDIEDWGCLESPPKLLPAAEWRRDAGPDLGTAVPAGSTLDMEFYFTRRWNTLDPNVANVPRTMAQTLATKITTDGTRSISLALYGVDDLNGSMKPVIDAVKSKLQQGVELQAVLDLEDGTSPNSGIRNYDVKIDGGDAKVVPLEAPLLFSYVQPSEKDLDHWLFGRPRWMDELYRGGSKIKLLPPESTALKRAAADAKWLHESSKNPVSSDAGRTSTRVAVQYAGSLDFLHFMNAGIKADAEARARVEWPSQTIMHNKFVVLDGEKGLSVWTGTANTARTCMGDELNSNMSVYIKNQAIASTYRAEFNEMFGFSSEIGPNGGLTGLLGGGAFPIGKFHSNKRPNTKRYFIFDDGTEATVHFSPTDDGEHRSIIPVLLSARKGDVIRVAMFGGAGLELVRAYQFAVAKGANVRIVLDKVLGAAVGSWIKDKVSVLDANPYLNIVNRDGASPGTLEVRLDSWKGLNHLKTGTLTRRVSENESRAEVLILGSQNWSANGNDENDENMISIRNTRADVAAAVAFNKFFDEELWPASNPAETSARP